MVWLVLEPHMETSTPMEANVVVGLSREARISWCGEVSVEDSPKVSSSHEASDGILPCKSKK